MPPGDDATRSPMQSSTCSRTSRAASRWGAPARVLAAERYAWEDIARRLEAIYERVAA